MYRRQLLATLSVVALASSASVLAADYGTPAEAKAMLDKAVVALKANKADALAKFTKGEGGFKDRDLYVYCGGPDGTMTAHLTLAGQSMKNLKGKAGEPIGEEMYKNAQEGKVSELSYMWPRPGTTEPLVQKVAYYTKAGDQICAVGYYK